MTAKDPHREKFVREFRSLMIKAGFSKEEVIKQGATEEGPDIIVNLKDVSVKILIQCRDSKNEELKEYSKLNDDIRIYHSYVDEYNAKLAILALKGYYVPEKFQDLDEMRKIEEKEHVVYWDDKVLQYYKATVKTIGKPFAKYAILKDLGIQLLLQKDPYHFSAFEIKQVPRGEKIWMFAAEPEKLLNICYVFRRGSRDPRAYQRFLKNSRLSQIGRFLGLENSVLANNLIVAFEEKPGFRKNTLSVTAKTGSVWVIDGQHRLFGFTKLDKKLDPDEKKLIKKQFKLLVAGIKAKPRLQAKLFTEVNAYQERINRNLLLDLYDYLDLDDEEKILTRIRITKKLMEKPVFRNKIKILPNEKGKITLAGIVDYGPFVNITSKLKRNTLNAMHEFFVAVQSRFPTEWGDSDIFVFTTNKGVRMLLSLLALSIDYCERKNKKMDSKEFEHIINALKDSTSTDQNFFKNENYTGLALGAGAPHNVATELWAARIDDTIEDFISPALRRELMKDEKEMLKSLELALRSLIERELSKVSSGWWKERIPQDVRKNAEEHCEKNEHIYPWYKGKQPLIAYVDFPDYSKIILRKDNWEIFKKIFQDPILLEAKLRELKPIRDDIGHNRKLIPDKLERLELYARDISRLIQEAEKQ